MEASAGDELRGELDRLVAAGEVDAMGSLTAQRWKERQRRKEAQIRALAMAEGLEHERRLLGSQAARRFDADTGERLSTLLADVSEPDRLAAVGDAIIDCGTGPELLAAAQRIVGAATVPDGPASGSTAGCRPLSRNCSCRLPNRWVYNSRSAPRTTAAAWIPPILGGAGSWIELGIESRLEVPASPLDLPGEKCANEL